jgi:hypothetical protein
LNPYDRLHNAVLDALDDGVTATAVLDIAIKATTAWMLREAAAAACEDCKAAKRHAYSDATTPGFFSPYCEKHKPGQAAVASTDPAPEIPAPTTAQPVLNSGSGPKRNREQAWNLAHESGPYVPPPKRKSKR